MFIWSLIMEALILSQTFAGKLYIFIEESQMSGQECLSALNSRIDHINLEGQLDSLFREQGYLPRHRGNIEISKHLLRTTANYLLLRENHSKMAGFSNQDLLLAHRQLKTANRLQNSRQPLNSALNSKYFLFSQAILAELSYRIIAQLGIAELSVGQPKHCFIAAVYVATGKLISPRCYELVLEKLKRKERVKRKPSLRSTQSNRSTMKEGTMEFSQVGSLVDEFRRQLRDNLYLKKCEKNDVNLAKSCKKVKSLANISSKISCNSRLPHLQSREKAYTVVHIATEGNKNIGLLKQSRVSLDCMVDQKKPRGLISMQNTATSSPKYSNYSSGADNLRLCNLSVKTNLSKFSNKPIIRKSRLTLKSEFSGAVMKQ